MPSNEFLDTWPTTLSEATRIQQELRGRVVLHDDFGQIRTVAGIDAGYDGDLARAVVVVLAFPSLEPLDYAIAWRPAPLPYIPGFLSFREGPAVMAALRDVRVQPDLIICDGQGIAHPRRLGIASHIGVLANIPSIGCAKSRLIGQHGTVPEQRGEHVPLTDAGEVIGAVLRTRTGTKPVYVSVGHRVSLEQAIHLVMACTTRYRLPETTRAADGLASHGRIPNIVDRVDSDPV
jgi:deoxyribonuclease V